MLITGSRDGHPDVWNELAKYLVDRGNPSWLVLGDASGVDRQALEFACARGVFFVVHTADWTRYGSAAGPIRNQKMVDCAGSSARALAFPHGKSTGTRGCVKLCRAAGIVVRVVER
jgi:hypothetical protein